LGIRSLIWRTKDGFFVEAPGGRRGGGVKRAPWPRGQRGGGGVDSIFKNIYIS